MIIRDGGGLALRFWLIYIWSLLLLSFGLTYQLQSSRQFTSLTMAYNRYFYEQEKLGGLAIGEGSSSNEKWLAGQRKQRV